MRWAGWGPAEMPCPSIRSPSPPRPPDPSDAETGGSRREVFSRIAAVFWALGIRVGDPPTINHIDPVAAARRKPKGSLDEALAVARHLPRRSLARRRRVLRLRQRRRPERKWLLGQRRRNGDGRGRLPRRRLRWRLFGRQLFGRRADTRWRWTGTRVPPAPRQPVLQHLVEFARALRLQGVERRGVELLRIVGVERLLRIERRVGIFGLVGQQVRGDRRRLLVLVRVLQQRLQPGREQLQVS